MPASSVIRVRIDMIVCCLVCWIVPPHAHGQKVNIEFDPKTDFSHVRLYEWRTHPVFEKHPELQELYATGSQLVMSAGNEQLMKQGLKPDDTSPDVYITFFIQASGGQSVRITDSGYGWYGPTTWSTEVERYVNGMLVIDIVDARTSKLMWRAYCGDKIKDFTKRHEKITAAVRKALRQFPPKQKP
jgi:hypothetical protein